MQKILWLIFLLVLGVKVEAKEVYYSDYTDFSEFQEQEIFASDIIDVETEQRYLWYKENQVLGDYQLYNLEDNFSTDCYLTNYSAWQDEKIANPGYVYETRNQYEYTKAKSVRYIHLYNLQGSYGAFRITELIVKINNQEIDYDYTCTGCLEGFDDYIHNGIYEENMSYIDNGGSLIIDLGQEYPLNQIELTFYIFDLGPSDKLYTLGYSKDKNDIFIAQGYLLQFADYHWGNAKKEVKKVTDLNIALTEWTTQEISYEQETDDSIVATEITPQYRYREKWCLIYQNEKEYYSEYTVNAIEDYLYRDEDSQKTFYRYRTRDKLEIDLFEIKEPNFDLNNFIVTSTDDVVIKNAIDWSKNGQYEVTFILNDLEVTKDVVLNIEANTIVELENQILNLKQELANLQTELLNQQQSYEAQLKELETKLTNCQSDNNCLKETLEQKELIIQKQEQTLQTLNNQINDLQVKLNDKIDQITYLTKDNIVAKDKITELTEEVNNLKNTAADLNQEILGYNNEIIDLDNLNDFYQKKIIELNEDLNLLNESIEQKLADKDNLIEQYRQKITELETKLNEDNECITSLKNEQTNNEDLNNKLNDYILKINNNRLFDITIIILLFLLMIYAIFKSTKPKK